MMLDDRPDLSGIKLFLSYAHEDREAANALLGHLGGLFHAQGLAAFDDSEIETGEAWRARIEGELERCHIFLALLSSNFTGSRFAMRDELLEAIRQGKHIIPVYLDHLDIPSLPVDGLQMVPKDRNENLVPIKAWASESEAWAEVTKKVRLAAEKAVTSGLAEAPAQFAGLSKTVHTLPPRPRMFGRDEEAKRLVALLDRADPVPAIVLGAGGLGKTTLTKVVMHDAAISARYGEHRFFVELETVTSIDGLLDAISSALGIEAGSDPENAIRQALATAPALLVLDNLETPWEIEEIQADVEGVLEKLVALAGTGLLASIRGGQVPALAWGDEPELERLPSPHDRELLLSIARRIAADDPHLEPVLAAMDGVPLAIELFAHAARSSRSLAMTWAAWQEQRNAVLSRAGGKARNLAVDTSIAASVESPRMDAPARRLLAALARLPDGLHGRDVSEVIPTEGHLAASRLLDTRLAHEDQDGRLRLLAPLREYAATLPVEPEDEARLYIHFLGLLDHLPQTGEQAADEAAYRRAREELINLDALLDRTLAASDRSPQSLFMVALASARIGDMSIVVGRLGSAMHAYGRKQEALASRANADPGNAEWQRDLSVSLERIGDVHVAQGRLDKALEAFEAGRKIREQLSAADPGNAGWQRDLFVSLNKIGDVHVAQGRLDSALEAFEAGRKIMEQLSAADPGNAGWQRDLSVSLNKIGDVHVAQGRLDKALEAFEAGRKIREQLSAADPGPCRLAARSLGEPREDR